MTVDEFKKYTGNKNEKKKNICTYRNIETNKRNYKPGSILFNTFENKLGMEHIIYISLMKSKYWRRVLDWILVNFLAQNLSWTRWSMKKVWLSIVEGCMSNFYFKGFYSIGSYYERPALIVRLTEKWSLKKLVFANR